MNINEALRNINEFIPSGNESADLDSLYSLTDSIEDKNNKDIKYALIQILEKYPDAELGSPGPIVHLLEGSEISEHIELLSASIKRKPTVMTIWMAERCLRTELSIKNKDKLLESLLFSSKNKNTKEVSESIQEALDVYKS